MAASEGGEGGCSSGEERAYERPLQQGVAKEEGLRERAASLQLSVKQTTEKRQVGGCPPPWHPRTSFGVLTPSLPRALSNLRCRHGSVLLNQADLTAALNKAVLDRDKPGHRLCSKMETLIAFLA